MKSTKNSVSGGIYKTKAQRSLHQKITTSDWPRIFGLFLFQEGFRTNSIFIYAFTSTIVCAVGVVVTWIPSKDQLQFRLKRLRVRFPDGAAFFPFSVHMSYDVMSTLMRNNDCHCNVHDLMRHNLE